MKRNDLHHAAAVLGRKGGSTSTPAKAAAARANGRLGGRPAQCAICRCPATTTVFGFRVCAYHSTHGEDAPSCPTCKHPKER